MDTATAVFSVDPMNNLDHNDAQKIISAMIRRAASRKPTKYGQYTKYVAFPKNVKIHSSLSAVKSIPFNAIFTYTSSR